MISAQEKTEPLVPTVSSTLQTSDKTIANEKLQTALEKSLSGQATRWQNPQSGVSGSVTPLKTWKTSEGTYCRSYTESIVLASGKSLNREGVACRTGNAVWKSA
ncbi:RT0821/Lpp0805 family surface protein [uncultured Roseibium sp.]|uniref:RT0821/Lpp0805 family surface protein n=1 Tax=uncultured Roseibium sp. TaxID=1936171 RepID=UPI0026225FA9|nr:RT0821/Lpp0805 family surface protein [uncultured Roseibium sp.]